MKHTLRDSWQRFDASRRQQGEELLALARRHGIWSQRLRVLDVGCGNGGISTAFALHGAKVVAIDFSVGRLKNTIDEAKRGGATLCGVLAADGCNLPLEPCSFDFVVLTDVIEHVPSARKLLTECARVLSSGGAIYVSVPNRHSLVNLIFDPHYGVPGIGMLPKRVAAWYVTRLLRLRPVYTVERYFGFREIRAMFEEVGLRAEILPNSWTQKIAAGSEPSDPRRMWMYRLSQSRWLRPLMLKASSTRPFRSFVAGSWTFICRPMQRASAVSCSPTPAR